MRIAVDVLGGDYAPAEILIGLGQALGADFRPSELLLVGPRALIEESLHGHGLSELPEILPCEQMVEGHESAVEAMRRKPEATVFQCVRAVKEGRADGMLSFGHTGATVAGATMGLGLLPGIRRPAIAVALSGASGPFVFLDVGANPNAKPEHLLQYALMGTAYARDMFGIAEPRVCLLNIGGEAGKGSPVEKETYKLLEDSSIRFVGNREGHELFAGEADVFVTDGFVGNVILKVVEGFAEYLQRQLERRVPGLTGGMDEELRRVAGAAHFADVGGATLLGVDGTVVIGHGRSRAHALPPALRAARNDVERGVNRHITESLRKYAAAHGAGGKA
ncbi:MAG: phosphate acyltransferase PlsX [Planctomycetota bacterium]|nr:MAG: phosphate acyltransferase PlsX [Planctomycetota bacterium]